MRDVSQWSVTDLEGFVAAGEEEGLHLDYKSSAALTKSSLRDDLSKDVAAFANADGGILIFGIEEGSDKRPARIDEGVGPDVMTAERLEDIVHSNVAPRPTGVRVHRIPLGGDRAAFAVSVPAASALAPHQASDRRYYRRYGTKNQPMYDHEVRDLMRRSSTAAPAIDIKFERVAPEGSGTYLVARFALINESPQPMEYGLIQIFMDARGSSSIGHFSGRGRRVMRLGGQQFELTVQEMTWTRDKLPVTPELPAELDRLEFVAPVGEVLAIGYEVRCPGAVSRRFGTYETPAGVIPNIVWRDGD